MQSRLFLLRTIGSDVISDNNLTEYTVSLQISELVTGLQKKIVDKIASYFDYLVDKNFRSVRKKAYTM